MNNIFNKKVFSKRLQEVMEENGDTTYSLGAYLHLTPSTIHRYCAGEMSPKIPVVEKIAIKYNLNPTWLMGSDKAEKYIENNISTYKESPIVGVIAAGQPILAEENIIGYEYVNKKDGVDFCLKVKGDSMMGARIYDGDIVFIHQQEDVENGEIAAVIIDGEEATLKRVYKVDGSVILRAENPKYEDKVFSKRDFKQVKIIGKAKYFKSQL